MVFREALRQALGGQEVLQDDWTTTAVIRETGKRVPGVTGGRKAVKKKWWWNEEVAFVFLCMYKKKSLGKKKLDTED